ncbi:MAG: helix-turn-helix transcriptional regulator [Flavobacterium sp.]
MNRKIKSLRELKNYTQQYMAEALEITQAAYSKIEKGKTNLSLNKLEKIAEILGVSIETLIKFDTKIYLDHLTNEKENSNQDNFKNQFKGNKVEKLYEEKIVLLELLLAKTDSELKQYKEKFGLL